MQRLVQIIKIKDEPGAIQAYRHAHDNIWPQIKEGIKAVGIQSMDLYLHSNTVVMIVEAPDHIEWESAFEELSHLPDQQEWEDFVAQWQDCAPGSTSAGKWQKMEKIFSL